MTKRHFTRAEVASFVLEVHKPYHNTSHEITDIMLLEGLPMPLWRVDYETVTVLKTNVIRTSFTEIYAEHMNGGEWKLLPLTTRKIPDGCATVEEEDAAIEAERWR